MMKAIFYIDRSRLKKSKVLLRLYRLLMIHLEIKFHELVHLSNILYHFIFLIIIYIYFLFILIS